MTATNGANICEPKNATRKYELLRANALGGINRATEFTLFLGNGMSAWLRSLQQRGSVRREMCKETPPVFTELDVDMPEVGLVAVLADAILKSARTADYRR
jgi:hypothetical protein